MANGRGRQPVTRCMNCGDVLVVVGRSGELEVPCRRQRCRKAGVSTPIRPVGFVPLPPGMEAERAIEILAAVQEGKLFFDPLAPYRQIKNLLVIGPTEIEGSFLGPKGENPLGLQPGWCPRPPLPETWTPENMKRLAELCQTPEWNTTPILWLALPEVAGKPTSLGNQYNWWGVSHGGLGPSQIQIRQDIMWSMWSNWFVNEGYRWTDEPAVDKPTWKIGYELPVWSTNLTWENQQKAAQKRGLTVAAAPSEALMLNLVAVSTGKKLRRHTYVRTATICVGCPLDVRFYGDGLRVYRGWGPKHVFGDLGLAAEGVPKELGF